MNKISLVLSLAAVAAVSGCLDPQYKSKRSVNQGTTIAKPVETVKPVEETPSPAPAEVEVVEEKKVAPVPEEKSVEVKPEFTTYIIQRGDTLSKISKRYNIKIDSIKASNPQIKNDIVRLGQKIKLPGNVDVGEQKVPEGSFASPSVKTKADKPVASVKAYTGATKEYVVKNGDTLGGIAIASGISVRQLKELNGLSKDMIRVGQKLKVPAVKVVKVSANAKANKKVEVVESKKADEKSPAAPANVESVEPKVEEVVENKDISQEVQSSTAEVAAPLANNVKYTNYTVAEGDDLIGISIRENLSVAEIRELNNIPPDQDIKPGMVIKLPVPAL